MIPCEPCEGVPSVCTWSVTDDTQPEFDAGTLTSTTWVNGALQIQTSGAAGEFISRTLDPNMPAAILRSFGWVPELPYQVALPDDGGSSGYPGGSIDMSDNILLFHFNAIAGDSLADGGRISDTSGHGHHGLFVHTTPASAFASAPFADGAFVAFGDYVRIMDANSHPDFNFGTGDFSWSVWVKPKPCGGSTSDNNRIFLGGHRNRHYDLGGTEPANFNKPYLNFYGACSQSCIGKAAIDIVDSNGKEQMVCSDITLSVDTWHHLAFVKAGHSHNNLTLFLDGVKYTTYAFNDTFTGDFNLTGGNSELRIASFDYQDQPGATFRTQVTIDETAMWRHALSDAEVSSLYQRGRLRLRAQIERGAEFVGGDGTAGSFFDATTSPASGPPAFDVTALGIQGQTFRYKLFLDTDDPAITPRITSVTLRGD